MKKLILIVGLILVISGGVWLLFFQDELEKEETDKKEQTQIEVESDKGLIALIEQQYQIENDLLSDLRENKYSFEEPLVVVDPYNISPLTALVMFLTEEEKEVTVVVEGKDALSTFEHTFSETKEHIIPIYGLYANKVNNVRIIIDEEATELEIITGELPEDFILPDEVTAKKEKLTNDLLFVTPVYSGGHLAAYDVNGDPRWYLTKTFGHEFVLKDGRLIVANGHQIASSITSGLLEIDLNGKIYYEYLIRNGYHHDYFIMENGDLLVASNDFETDTLADVLALIDRETGRVKKTWNFTETLPQDEGRMENWQPKLWLHINSVWYDKNTNAIIVSGRHQDIVVSVDYDSGELNWLIGNPVGWSEEMQSYFFKPIGDDFEWSYAQHAAKVLPNGDIFLFDNGNNRSKIPEEYVLPDDNYSRGVIYRIDTDNMTIEQIWEYGKSRGSDFYSPYVSNVEYYSENHYLIHSGGIVSLDGEPVNTPPFFIKDADLKAISVEILNDEVILEMIFPMNYYRGKKYALYQENKFQFGPGKVLGEFFETNIEHPMDKLLKRD